MQGAELSFGERGDATYSANSQVFMRAVGGFECGAPGRPRCAERACFHRQVHSGKAPGASGSRSLSREVHS